MIIYKITNTINDKAYIGQTMFTLERRWRYHSRNPNNTHFGNAIQKYGLHCWKLEVLENVTERKLLNEREIYWVAYYNTFNSGYNSTAGGLQNTLISEQTKSKISASLTGKTQRKRTPEQNKANSERQKGKKQGPRKNKLPSLTEERKLALSIKMRGKPQRKRTIEERMAQSIIQSGKKHKPRTEEQKLAQSIRTKGKPGRKWTEEEKHKRSKKLDTRVICPTCNKSGNGVVMLRWHFTNCKHNVGTAEGCAI
jgi:group I intron endonuclease